MQALKDLFLIIFSKNKEFYCILEDKRSTALFAIFFLLTNKIFIHKISCNYKIFNTLSIVTGEYIYLVGQ